MPKKTPPELTFWERLKEFRQKELDLSLREVAKAIEMDPSQYAKVEKGYLKMNTENLRRLADLYSVNTHWLLTGTGEMYAYNDATPLISFLKTQTAEWLRSRQYPSSADTVEASRILKVLEKAQKEK